jgi:hypothetical protein
MSGSPYTLDQTVDLSWRHVLDDKIYRTNVNPQLECTGADESLDLACLERFFGSDSLFLGKRAVMYHYLLVHHIELRAKHLCVDATVDKDQSRIMSLNKV